MTGNEIKDKIERFFDIKVNSKLIIDGIQEAINWLGNMGYIIDTILLEAEEETFIGLPVNLIRIIKVENLDENEYCYDYKVDGDLIRFKEEGNYRIFAERHPSEITSLDEELSMHSMLSNCILTYVKGFIKLSNDDENKVGWEYIKKFQQDSIKAYQLLKRNQSNPTKWKVIKHA